MSEPVVVALDVGGTGMKCALVRPDGTVLVHADAALPVTQALIRWDPVTFAERTLAELSG